MAGKKKTKTKAEKTGSAPKTASALPKKTGAAGKEPKKLSALSAAARILGESGGQALNCQEMIAAMAAKGYWTSPKGMTPAASLYAAILRELQTKKEAARFRKAERGKFTLA